MTGRTRRWRRCGAGLAMAVIFLAGCGSGSAEDPTREGGDPAISIVDDAGRSVSLGRPARRIVSLVPSITETILALGEAERLVARTRYDDAPEVRDLPSVGGGLDPSIEAIVGLQPDVVVAWRSIDDRGLRERLEASGIPVVAVSVEDTTDVVNAIERVGRLIGRADRADSLVRAVRDSLAAVRREAIASSPEVLYLLGGEPPRIAGPRAFVSQLVGVAGGRNPFPDVESRWPAVSLEEIVARDPDVIVVPRHEESDERSDLARRSGWRDLAAVRSGRVGTIDADLVSRPGPGLGHAARALRDTLAAILDRRPLR